MKDILHEIKTWFGGHHWQEASAPLVLMGIEGEIVARVCSCGFKDPNGHFVPGREWISNKIYEFLGEEKP